LTWHNGIGGLLFALAWGAPVLAPAITMALLVVQPRRHWAARDPAMDDHRW
jgi:hypothetical protein